MTLYHKFIYMPPEIENYPLTKYENIFVTSHALHAMEDDGLTYFDNVIFSGNDIFEVDIDKNGNFEKIVLALKYNDAHNLKIILVKDIYKKYPFIMRTVYLEKIDKKYNVNILAEKYIQKKNIQMCLKNNNHLKNKSRKSRNKGNKRISLYQDIAEFEIDNIFNQ